MNLYNIRSSVVWGCGKRVGRPVFFKNLKMFWIITDYIPIKIAVKFIFVILDAHIRYPTSNGSECGSNKEWGIKYWEKRFRCKFFIILPRVKILVVTALNIPLT